MGRKVDDEWYTRPEDVARMLMPFRADFAGRSVLCPCDGEGSAYVAWLRDAGAEVSFSLCFEEWDFADFDAVVTNPPFSRSADFVTKVLDEAKAAHVIVPAAFPISTTGVRACNDHRFRFYTRHSPDAFLRPDGTEARAACMILTTWRYGDVTHRAPRGVPPTMTDEGILRYGTSADVPEGVTGVVGVPPTFFASRADAEAWECLGFRKLHAAGRAFMSSLLVRHRA